MKAKILLLKVIRIRKRLIKEHRSGKNASRCLVYIDELSKQIEAYGKKWDEYGWNAFLNRNKQQVEYLIPENKSGTTIKHELYEIIESFCNSGSRRAITQ